MKISILCLCLLLLSAPAWAQNDDETFENAVRNFGYVSGLAHQCVPDAQKLTVERDVIKAYTGIVSLFGSDDAFFYAAAFGAGSTAKYDKKKCPEYEQAFKTGMQRGRAGK